MKQNALKPSPGSRKNRKRVGRGPGSGSGKTSSRGENGQKSRSGASRSGDSRAVRCRSSAAFEAQLHQHLRVEYRTVNVDRLNELPAGSEVTPEFLQKLGLLRKGTNPVKVLGNGDLTIALTVRAHKYTGSAVQKIEAAGGKAEVIS
jgi:large subunit ribosomal protein L15